MTMFEVKLKEGRRKGRFRGFQSLKQPLPVPISSLTELKASDSTWRFYHGKLEEDNAGLISVLIEDKQEIDFVYEMGYFGTIYNSEKARKSKSRQKSKFCLHFFFLTHDCCILAEFLICF